MEILVSQNRFLRVWPSMAKEPLLYRMCLILLFIPSASLSNITISFFTNHLKMPNFLYSQSNYFTIRISQKYHVIIPKANIAFPNLYVVHLKFLILNYDFVNSS